MRHGSAASTRQAANRLIAMHLHAKRSSCANRCLHGISTATRTYEHLEGAYGVLGFSGVKDARKSVFIADALASADRSCSPTALLLRKCGK
jgi:hypothetical protein